LSHGIELDLVSLEDVYPEMRVRILQGVDMADNAFVSLKLLIQDEFTGIDSNEALKLAAQRYKKFDSI
jgi:hypothetical protein